MYCELDSSVKMQLFTVSLLLLVISLAVVDIADGARGRGGGSRGGGSRSRSSSSRSRSGSSSGSKPKITKQTPIKTSTVRSPVIKLQTQTLPRSSMLKKVLVGYAVYRYTLSRAPVYRGGYPMYGTYVTFPPERAVRLSSVEEKMLDAEGNLCLGESAEEEILRSDINDYLVELNTTITYKDTGEKYTLHGINKTISLKDIKKQDFVLMSQARYNATLVPGTNCTKVEKRVEGTMVQLYETNPDGANTFTVNTKLLLFSIVVLGFRHVFMPF